MVRDKNSSTPQTHDSTKETDLDSNKQNQVTLSGIESGTDTEPSQSSSGEIFEQSPNVEDSPMLCEPLTSATTAIIEASVPIAKNSLNDSLMIVGIT